MEMTDQEKVDKVLKGLEICKEESKLCFGECECGYQSYFPRCWITLASDAHDLLKSQCPRLMTLEEVKAMKRYTICAVEQRSKVLHTTFNAEYRGHLTIGGRDCIDFGLYADVSPFRRSESGYGKTWRCWTSRPTNEQREATPWE